MDNVRDILVTIAWIVGCVFVIEHITRKIGWLQPSTCMRFVYDRMLPIVVWIARRVADMLCFLAVIDLDELYETLDALVQPSLLLVFLPFEFVRAIYMYILELKRPITFFTGLALLLALGYAHTLYPERIEILLAADGLVVLFALYNTLLPTKTTPASPKPKRRARQK